MLWSKPFIIYDVIPTYSLKKGVPFWMRWQISQDPYQAVRRNGNVAVISEKMIDETIKSSAINIICWQHLFLFPHLKIMQTGWHLCLLPRHMVTVIQDGIYLCERQVTTDVDIIDSTKKYAYRYGYEPDIIMHIHDFRADKEAVEIPIAYQGFVFHLPHPWYAPWLSIGRVLAHYLKQYALLIMLATVISLSVGILYYGIDAYKKDDARMQLIKHWPGLQHNKHHIQNFLDLMGVLTEAATPKQLCETIQITQTNYQITCDQTFHPDQNLVVFQAFLKKYAPHAVQARAESNRIQIVNAHK